MHDESNTISNEEIIEDAKWLGKRKNKYDDDDDNNNSREGMQQGGNRKNIVNRERRIVENSSGVDSSSSSSNNAYKNECMDSNPSCLMWACDGECDANPTFMSGSCPCACEGMTKMKINNPETIDFNDDEFHLHVEWYDEKSRERRRGRFELSWTVKTRQNHRNSFVKQYERRVRDIHFAAHPSVSLIAWRTHMVSCKGNLPASANLVEISASALKVLPIRSHGIMGVFGSIPGGGDDFLIATKNHKEWDLGFTPIGRVHEEDMVIVEKLLALKTEEVVHPTYKTKMAILKSPLRFYLSS